MTVLQANNGREELTETFLKIKANTMEILKMKKKTLVVQRKHTFTSIIKAAKCPPFHLF